jgi:hypothetical protein
MRSGGAELQDALVVPVLSSECLACCLATIVSARASRGDQDGRGDWSLTQACELPALSEPLAGLEAGTRAGLTASCFREKDGDWITIFIAPTGIDILVSHAADGASPPGREAPDERACPSG